MSEDILLSFNDALRIARGCHDYNGGYTGGQYDAYHHGIQTVITALEAAEKGGSTNPQIATLWRIGGEEPGK